MFRRIRTSLALLTALAPWWRVVFSVPVQALMILNGATFPAG